MSIAEDEIPMEKVRDLIDQPVDGLLYDLNMLPEVLATLDKVNTRQWLVMKVIQALYEKQEWINVEDKLPEPNSYVWVYDNKAIFDSKKQRTMRFDPNDKAWKNGSITHWKPLPKPPKNTP